MPRVYGLPTKREPIEPAKGTVEPLREPPFAGTEPEPDVAVNQFEDQDFSDEELEALLIREITIDGMCGIY